MSVDKNQENKQIVRAKYREYNRIKRYRYRPESEWSTAMKGDDTILEVEDLRTCFYTSSATIPAVDGISFSVGRGKVIGIVGESGCGKSVTGLSIMGLLPGPRGQISGGTIRYWQERKQRAVELTRLGTRQYGAFRGSEIAMIFQEPMTALDPLFPVGKQIDECLRFHNKVLSPAERRNLIRRLLASVGIGRDGIYNSYPFELSGGMLQRVLIAIALCGDPKLIIADEPTTALDVTIQAQILLLLKNLQKERGISMLFISHDLGVIAGIADEVIVMYAGCIAEQGTVREIFDTPCHPYTAALMRCRPDLERETDMLEAIPGTVPDLRTISGGCHFQPRCVHFGKLCTDRCPPYYWVSKTHRISCFYRLKKLR
ncbi:MAG: ABC transporter ATP-binding protein [Spirochaetaceae bacterium]|jgi:peptide/nickel transport system ATP-binding protein|nr:ABC transporter ATP-binding protein [Spirochaetaceae bacterium]